MKKIELDATPIPDHEAQEIMLDDAVALLSNDISDPLAKAIEEALAALDRALNAHRSND